MKERIQEFANSLGEVFDNLDLPVNELSKCVVGKSTQFEMAASAAFVKAYEFNCAIPKSIDEHIYFMLPALRSICEDYIVLKFISDKLNADSSHIIERKALEDLYRSAVVQWDFFTKNHPAQTLYYKDDFGAKETEQRDALRSIMNANGIMLSSRKATLPTVRDMAEKSDLLELYLYVYHATSSLVHFNPRMLLRMGWGDLPDITFSVSNFKNYHRHFACFYGAFLFANLSRWMISINLLDQTIEPDLQKIDDLLKTQERWPELVTFEEANIGTLSKIMFYKSPAEKVKSQNR